MAAKDEQEHWRAELFQAIGAVVVAGGHVEWRMQRLLLWLRGQGPESLTTIRHLQWTGLANAIDREAVGSPKAAEIKEVLSVERQLNAVRNNVVHAYWWTDGGPGIRGNRHPKYGGGFIIVGTSEQLIDEANKLFAFANRLAGLTPNDGWPIAKAIDGD